MQLPRPAWLCFLLIFTAILVEVVHAGKLKLCVVDSQHTAKKIKWICQKLKDDPESKVECSVGNDRFHCLRHLIHRESDFTVLEPEDLFATYEAPEYNIFVTNELRFFSCDKERYQMVAIVNKKIKNTSDLRGKNFCHPGYEPTEYWNRIFSTYFEKSNIVPECELDKTLIENRISTLSDYFRAACIAGPWSPDSVLDTKLKSRYKNLCALCENPAGCFSGDKYYGREGALLCLTDSVGDVAWVMLKDAKEHFKEQNITTDNFSFLCPDGMTKPIDFDNPCVWISRPWPVVVTRRDAAERVASLMRSLDPEKTHWNYDLIQLLESYHVTPVSTEILGTSEDYLQRFPGFVSANSVTSCRPFRTVTWCETSNVQDKKCRWLGNAVKVYGIEPLINCIQETSREACMEAVRTHRADFFVAKPEEELQARKKGLKPILFAVTSKTKDVGNLAAVVMKNSPYLTLKDLKGTSACFAGFRSIGWNTFAAYARNFSSTDRSCTDVETIANFFKDSCVSDLPEKDSTLPNNLYSLCEHEENLGDEDRTFRCLASGRGNVAFINWNTVTSNTVGLNSSDFRTLCLDESMDDGEPCFLACTAFNTVMVHENISETQREELYFMFLEIDLLFGRNYKGQTPAFSLYGKYEEKSNILFSEKTQRLQKDISHMHRAKRYSEIVDDLLRDVPCSTASLVHPYICQILPFMLTLLFYRCFHS
ncbi:transferrin isoform X2 [Orussus abietinus]|uniref:transferrin isoform X2 n=1 Tax=Orussus abietinus TaxID=222816 RepID=UPI000625141B|nr:transferrin isoform X2 [Orussus abietinus]